MARDIQHQHVCYTPFEIAHCYGKRVHILSNPYLLTVLAKLCHPSTVQPFIDMTVEQLYEALFQEAVGFLFPKKTVKSATRMAGAHPLEAHYEGDVIDPDTRVVCVNLARAGTFPSHICYSRFNTFMNPDQVRQDHFICNRKTDDKGQVIGVDISGSKIGGPIDNAIVFFPDPMGATGGTISVAIDEYKHRVGGKPLACATLHLVITPEYIRHMTATHPDVDIFTIRLDRGMSAQDVLDSIPGTFPDREFGLNQHQYIIPGAGGIGEIMNNSFV